MQTSTKTDSQNRKSVFKIIVEDFLLGFQPISHDDLRKTFGKYRF